MNLKTFFVRQLLQPEVHDIEKCVPQLPQTIFQLFSLPQAVGAYQRALEIEPGFIRARYNVGVVCINLKSYKEAGEHLLMALNHQATSKQRAGVNVENIQNQMSDTLWSTLRMTISLMGKHELQDFIDKRDLDSLNKAFM